ncbi:DUF488 domain-containing protein [Erythrobacter sp. JGD-13]|uniref:DUF488 domain-containing protein n=1 Tax=Aurantiacibacter sediminis TaxID=2793064 RepID=A0ABS0N4D0_9SPHN|nr:DUF488 domain-containing protein [Aurantiacibacter sediminis]
MRPSIWTIGYAQQIQHSLITTLKAARIEVLADVRAIANSRRPGFAKTSLQTALEAADIAYTHIPELGTSTAGRAAARRGDVETLREIYEEQLLSIEAAARMLELQTLAKQRRVCLLCYCEDAHKCHRGILADKAFAKWRRIDL